MFALYARVSTDDQNIEQQVKVLKDYAKAKGFNVRTYQDYAISGRISERPQWQKLLRDIEKGEFEGVIVTKYDRITRDLKYSIEFLEWFQPKEIRLISIYDGEFNNTPDAVFTFKLKCLLSEHELQQTKWRSKIGIARAKAEGKYKGRKKGAKNRPKN